MYIFTHTKDWNHFLSVTGNFSIFDPATVELWIAGIIRSKSMLVHQSKFPHKKMKGKNQIIHSTTSKKEIYKNN